MIAVVDYGAGNLASVRKALVAVGAEPRVVGDAADLGRPSGLVVPGVGHFGATSSLGQAWRDAVAAHVRAGRPLLGICLGMQWLFEASEEAPGCPGLGLLGGTCLRLGAADRPGESNAAIKVPHVGWNRVEPLRPSGPLGGVDEGAYAYFTHSYAAPVTADTVATSRHGRVFAAVVERGVVWGTQFHPEKSGDAGLRILANFVSACREKAAGNGRR